MLIQIGLYDSTSTSKLLLSFVRLTYLKKTTAGCAAVGPLFFRKVGSNPWPSCISGTGRKLTSDMGKKGWPSSRRPFGWICRCTKKSIKQTNCRGVSWHCSHLLRFFLFYSTIMIFTLADQLQRPTKQLTVLQIVSKKVLWMSSTFRCESSPPRYPHGDFWSWLLGLPGFFFEWLPFQENIHPLQQAGTAKCYKVVVMWKMGRRWLLQS